MTTFGDELAHLLAVRGISQSRFAARVGVDHSYISRIVTGEREPSHAMIARIIETLEVDDREAARLMVLWLIPERYQPLLLAGLWEHREDADELWTKVSETLTEQWRRKQVA